MRFSSLRRGRLGSRLGHGQNLDTADFLANVAHGNSVGTRPGNRGVSAVPTIGYDYVSCSVQWRPGTDAATIVAAVFCQ